MITLLSFTTEKTPAEKTAQWYDKQTSALINSLTVFKKSADARVPADSLLKHFYTCRNIYKRTELFIDAWMTDKARMLNGPDLLKINEDSPTDSIQAHGFQVVERLLFEERIDIKTLSHELHFMLSVINELRNNPNRKYYFADNRIWLAMRLGTYKIISMGITGFDVPISFHALPETREVLATMKYLSGVYMEHMPDSVWQKGRTLFSKADAYLAAHNNFNTFDRLAFIRNYMSPISEWLAYNGRAYINTDELYPLNPYASHLFARDIININFFSPNPDHYATPQRIALGKRLFYDPILSGDGSRSCASCHKPEMAFTDGLVKATAFNSNKPLRRNTPTLWNAALQTAQFYDSRAHALERQMSIVVHNPDEMNGSVANSMPRIIADTAYNRMFHQAYANEPEAITQYNIGNAVASYIRSLISFNSRFDRYIRNETDSLTQAEKNGFNLFMGKARCGTCHYAPLFNGLIPPLYQDTESETLAVPETDKPRSTLDKDEGRYLFTQLAYHRYSFKTPTVRNIALTAPYMHNGAFATLESVIDLYNDGGGAGRGIVLATQTLPPDKLGLTKKEKQDIIAFLHTLTDTASVH